METLTQRLLLVLSIVVLGCFSRLMAQSDENMISQRPVLRVLPVFQRWLVGDNLEFSQIATDVSFYTPLSRDFGMTLRAAQASTSGDVANLSGFSDIRLSANYYMERPGLMLSCGIGLPTGKRELTQDEFETSILTSTEVFDLRSTSLGQGLSLQPGVTWAKSIGEKFSFGAGVSFHYRGKYKPLAAYGDYDPGDEILLTVGFDARVSERSSIAADFVITSYGTDKLDGEIVFAAGRRISLNVQFKTYIGPNELLALARYGARGKNDIGYAGVLQTESEKFSPDQAEISVEYRMVLSDRVTLRMLVDANLYQETPSVFSDARLFGVGIMPEFKLSESVVIPVRAAFRAGKIKGDRNLSGFEIGAGLAVFP